MCNIKTLLKLGIILSVINNEAHVVQSKVVASPLFGSAELGVPFDDGVSTISPSSVGLHSLNISCGAFVFGVQASYRFQNGHVIYGAVHGTVNEKTLTAIVFQKEEEVVRVAGATDEIHGYITQLKLYTRLSDKLVKSYGPYGNGKSSDTPFSIAGAVTGLFGRSGHFLNALGVYTNSLLPPLYNKTQMVGGVFGLPFDDYPNVLSSGLVRLLNLTINTETGGYIYGIRATYLLPNGTFFVAFHGPSGPNEKIIRFHETEMIVQTDVAIFSLFVNYLVFSTLDSGGTRRKYGPYGGMPLSNITTIHGTVYGFFGKVGSDHITALTGLGCYV